MKQRYQALLVGLIIIAIIVMLHMAGITNYLSIQSLSTKKDMLKWVVRRHYVASVFYYLLLYVVVIACAVPAVAPLTMLAGFLFGVLPGALYSLIGSTVGATCSFFVVRYLLKNTVQKKYRAQLQEFNERLGTQGISNYLLTLQFLTVVPFFVINTLASLAHVPVLTFVWTTVVGSLPIVLLYSFAGRQLTHISSAKDIFSLPVVFLLGALVCLALVPIVVRRIRARNQYE